MVDFNPSNLPMDFLKGCVIDFDPVSGMSKTAETGKRYLSQMRGAFADEAAYEAALAHGDAIVYEFHSLPLPQTDGDLAFGCSIVYPGKVGNEYYMTKGHFHTILETGEVYYCLQGKGYMLLESPDGDWRALAMEAGKAVYVPKHYAHRSVNTSATEKLVTFFVFRADAGHDYGTIETKGYRKLIVEQNGAPAVMDNQKWK